MNTSKKTVVILLGSLKYVKHDSNAKLLVVDTVETQRFQKFPNIIYLQVTQKNSLEIILSYCKKNMFSVKGVINRKDSFELLYGKLCENFGVQGPSEFAVKNLSDKVLLHKLMGNCNLEAHRPKSIISTIDSAPGYFKQFKFPIILKNNTGSKSHGVIKIHTVEEFEKQKEILTRNMVNLVEDSILIEEFLIGKQVAPAMYIDKNGKVKIISLVDIITAREVGQNHMQLIYRTTPSEHSDKISRKIESILQALADATNIKSTMLHPEFFVKGDNVYLIEINVRIAGFREDLLKNAYGLDLAKLSFQLAMDLPIVEEKLFTKSSTVCEVWSEKSGIIKTIEVPQNEYIVSLKYGLKPGDNYIAPPLAQNRLALFYVTSPTNSLSIAKKIREDTSIEFI